MEVTALKVEAAEPSSQTSDAFSLSRARLRQFVAYARKVYKLRRRLAEVRDGRRDPKYAPLVIATTIFFCGLLRVRSFNALEPRLQEKPFMKLVGAPVDLAGLGSADTLSRALRVTDLGSCREVVVGILGRAERNKVFREGWHGTLRFAAVDGWEPVQSWNRHCPHCLVRHVKKKDRSGNQVIVDQYYHRYVVAMLVDERMDLAIDIEPVLPADLRAGPLHDVSDEGELTAAKRLVRRLRQTYRWIDVIVADALYANGPFLTLLRELGLGGVIIARKPTDEPLKEALWLWGDKPANRVIDAKGSQEQVELWDCRDLETLETYQGKIRVVRGRVSKTGASSPSTWSVLVTGKASRLSARQVLAVARGRWHIENTGFHQWTTRWQFTHVFTHDGNGILALYWLFFAAYNLLTLFLYRRLKCYGRDRGADVTRTISRLIDEMRDDLARLTISPWDTS